MKVLVLGGTGATGKQLIRQLIELGVSVRTVVRQNSTVESDILESPQVEILRAGIYDATDVEIDQFLDGCDAIVSCLGHNITFKGLFGHPRNLVSKVLMRIHQGIQRLSNKKMKLLLMNTTAFNNNFTGEKNNFAENVILGVLELVLPPHRDNMVAVRYLIRNVGKEDSLCEWIALRPDELINEEVVTPYRLVQYKERSPIFNSGQTSRINVGHAMAKLLTNETLWEKWKYKTPVIYNE